MNEPGTPKTPPGELHDPAVQARNMAALLGVTPGSRLTREAATVGLIAAAKARGVTWRQIGSALGCGMDPKKAKAMAKRLARAENARILAAKAGRGDG